MFTGLVQTTGTVRQRVARGSGFALSIAAKLGTLELGESICVNGACLTVTECSAEGFAADITAETVACTTLGRLSPGARLNLERSLRVGDRLGGHWVVGHVDGVARVDSISADGEARRVVVRPPGELVRFLAPKGSVTLDGVSLTVNRVDAGAFEVMLIPHTLTVTNLEKLRPEMELNLEVDLLARYVTHWLEATRGSSSAPSGLERALEQAGFTQ